MTLLNRSRKQLPCCHGGPLAEVSQDLSALIQAVQDGSDLLVRGVCLQCRTLIERRYVIRETLPALAATLWVGNTLTECQEAVIREDWMQEANGIPAQLFVVHPDIIRAGACGLSGMPLVGLNRVTKAFRYQCRCNFEWELAAQDLQQAIVQGLHRSSASRRLALV
jgi:hypothetical protein